MTEANEEVKENPVLEIAKELGYNPDFEGENKKTPEEFILYSKDIEKKQSGTIRGLIGTVDKMSKEFVAVQETFANTIDSQNARHAEELKKEKAQLETKFETAVDEADIVEAKKIQKELKEVEIKQAQNLKKDPPPVNADQAYFDKWRDKHIWIDDDKKAQAEFKKAHIDLLTEHGEGRGAEFELAYIEKKLKEKMPAKFGLKPKDTPPAGDIGEGKSTTKISKDLKVNDLNSEEKALFTKFKKAAGKHYNEKSTLNAISAMRAAKGAK